MVVVEIMCLLCDIANTSVRSRLFLPGKLRTGKEYSLERGITPFKVSFVDV